MGLVFGPVVSGQMRMDEMYHSTVIADGWDEKKEEQTRFFVNRLERNFACDDG